MVEMSPGDQECALRDERRGDAEVARCGMKELGSQDAVRQGMKECALARMLEENLPRETAEEAAEVLIQYSTYELSRIVEGDHVWHAAVQRALDGKGPEKEQQQYHPSRPRPTTQKTGLRVVTQQQAGRPQATIQHGSLRLATLNVRGLSGEGRLEELAAALNSADIGICVLQETKVRRGMTNVEVGGYVFHTTPTEHHRGMGLAMQAKLRHLLDGGRIVPVSDRLLVVETRQLTLVNVYAPVNGNNIEVDVETKNQFEMELRGTIDKFRAEKMVVLGDFNATMEQAPDGRVVAKNDNGERLEALVDDYALALVNWHWGNPEEEWTWGGAAR